MIRNDVVFGMGWEMKPHPPAPSPVEKGSRWREIIIDYQILIRKLRISRSSYRRKERYF